MAAIKKRKREQEEAAKRRKRLKQETQHAAAKRKRVERAVITIQADGEGEKELIEALVTLIQAGFETTS